jgi:Beta-propeller repeat
MGRKLERSSWALSVSGSILLLALAAIAQFSDPQWLPNPGASLAQRFASSSRGRVPRRLPDYAPDHNLMFDPVLAYATFLGGANYSPGGGSLAQAANVVFVDGSGNLYVGGETNSASFPVTPGVVQPDNSAANGLGFLSKLDPTGQSLIFSTYINGISGVSAMTVDAAGNIYLAGPAGPPDNAGFPVLPIPHGSTPFQAEPKGSSSIGILKLNNTASAVLGATYLGGSAFNFLTALAVDSSDNLYMTGSTTSNDFPTQAPLQSSLGSSGRNAFVTVLDSTLSTAVYSTYLGQASTASSGVGPHSIAVDGLKNAYVVGQATPGFPTTSGAIQTTCAAASANCAFLAKLNPAGSALLYSTYVGNAEGSANAVAVDASRNAYISGQTTGTGFPEVNPVPEFQSFCALNGNSVNGFVSEISAAGSLTFSTCSPSSGPLVLDSSGNIYIAGSAGTGFPLAHPIQSNPGAGGATFIAAINPNTASLVFSSFIGGAQQTQDTIEGETLADIGVDTGGNIYAAGYQYNYSLPLPVFNALQPVPSGNVQCPVNPCYAGSNAILLKIAPTDAAADAVAPALVIFPPQQVGAPSAPQTVTIFDMGSAGLTVSNASATGDFSLQNGCTTVAATGGTCAIQVTFTPTVLGTRTGTLTITDSSAGSPRTVQLTGQGAQASATLSPASLAFPSQQPGTTSATQTVTLTNSGAIALEVSSVQTTGPFSEFNTCGSSVLANGTCAISVTFSPSTTGTAGGTLTLADSAADSPQTVSLTGTGGTPSLGLGVASGGSAAATVTAGATATYALSIGGSGMSGAGSLTCTGAPTGSVCSVPATLALSASSASTFNASVSTTSRSAVAFYPHGSAHWLWALAIFGCLTLSASPLQSSLSRLRLAPLLLLAVGLCSCGGGSTASPTPNPNGTPAGTYTMVITAKSGTTTQTQNLTLTVQ